MCIQAATGVVHDTAARRGLCHATIGPTSRGVAIWHTFCVAFEEAADSSSCSSGSASGAEHMLQAASAYTALTSFWLKSKPCKQPWHHVADSTCNR